MYIVVGLGNPGRQYDGTRHNIGFEVIDLLAKRHGIKIKASKFDAYAGEEFCLGSKLILVKPDTFMNLSGKAVKQFLRFYKLPDEDFSTRLIVIYDDTDLEPGQIRIRPSGGAGGHNGIKNIIYLTERDDFIRIRVGVGKKAPGFSQSGHVLARFTKSQEDDAIKGIIKAANALEDIMRDGLNAAMNKHNGDDKPKPPPVPKNYPSLSAFLQACRDNKIDNKFITKLEKKHATELTDTAKHVLSKAPSGCTFDDDATLQLLSRSQILQVEDAPIFALGADEFVTIAQLDEFLKARE